MTITQAPQATKNSRDLISEELFGKFVTRAMEDQPVSAAYAGVVVEQALVFLATIATNPNADMLTPQPHGRPRLARFRRTH